MRQSSPSHFRRLGFAAALLSAAALAPLASAEAAEVKPITIRIASDLTGPPHPAAIAKEYLKELIEQRVPGSSVRTYYAGALYNIPEAVEAMTEGNLEMVWAQFGKTAVVDPYMNVVIGPQLMTTPGAINSLDQFETVKMIWDRLAKVHDIKVFGTAHMSMYMGAGSGKRLLSPDDFVGKKIRSMGPAENAALKAWGANPTTMAFGDVPPALQTGVIDGLLTSLGGFNATKDQAPYYTIAGINGIVGDYYWIGASGKWWRKLDAAQQKDPAKPGVYIMQEAERKALADKLGNATAEWVKANTPADAHQWVDKFGAEAKAAVAAHPIGSDPLEKTDCAAIEPYFTKYTVKKG
jgi:TRAP-type C4-dicarboxylate transport system substrate-binding protein